MPTSDFTSKLLELEDVLISDLHTSNTEVHLFFSLRKRPHTCPHCGSITESVHDYRTSVLKDLPFMGKKTFLHYRKRRYHCPNCRKHFYESFPLLPKYCRITTRLAFSGEMPEGRNSRRSSQIPKLIRSLISSPHGARYPLCSISMGSPIKRRSAISLRI